MLFRPMTSHPAFAPLIGAIAVVIALIIATLPAATPLATDRASATVAAAVAPSGPAPAVAPVIVSGRIAGVRTGTRGTLIEFVVGSRTLQLQVDPRARITMPAEGRIVFATASSLRAGQQARLQLAGGDRASSGATVRKIEVDPGFRPVTTASA